jgi:hypothetical protein
MARTANEDDVSDGGGDKHSNNSTNREKLCSKVYTLLFDYQLSDVGFLLHWCV